MLNELKYRLGLNKLRKIQKKIDKEYNEDIKAEKQGRNRPEKLQDLNAIASHEYFEIDHAINKLRSDHLGQIASSLSLPLPNLDDKEMWKETDIDGMMGWVLTENGIAKVRADIRNEKRERFDIYGRWVTLIVGLIGAVTGLLAVILK